MATVLNHPLAPVAPPAAVARILSRFDRDQLAAFISVAIDLLDVADGDPDVELNGDEKDGSLGEDDFHDRSETWSGMPGCPVSDPPEADGDERDGNGDEDDFITHAASGPGCPVSDPDLGVDDQGEGDAPPDERVLAPALDRIRQTRCVPEYRLARITGYSLKHWPTVPSGKQMLKRKRGMPKTPRA